MRFSTVAAALLPVAGVLAADHVILVGDTGLDFNPSSITAAQGDNLIFSFVQKNHTVTQSTFNDPCTQSGTIDSGFKFIEQGAGPANFTVPVNDSTTPVWFYCKQVVNGTSHCSQGMVFALNPTADKTFDAFQAKAKSTTSDGSSASNSSSSAAPSPSGSSTSSSGSSSSASPSSTGQSSGAAQVGTTAALAMSLVGLAAGVLL